MRTFKQIAYGLLYLLILAGILYAVYLIWLRPAPSCFNGFKDAGEEGADCGGVCSKACLPSGLSAIEITGDPKIFHPTPSSISVMAEIQNKNPGSSAKVFRYKFGFYDAQDKLLHEISGESFLYSSEIKYVAEFNLQFPDVSEIAYAKFLTGEPLWVSDSLFGAPNLKLQNSKTSSSDSGLQATGSFINNSGVTISRVTVFTVFYSNIGQPAGISKNEVEGVMPGEQRSFSVFHPPLSNINLSGTEIYLYGE